MNTRDFDFDVTTEWGRKNALKTLSRPLYPFSSLGWLFSEAIRAVIKGRTAAIEAQKDAAVEIIKAGKDNNVDKMTITLDRTAGIDLGSDVEGIPIRMKIGDSGKVSIEVQYRA